MRLADAIGGDKRIIGGPFGSKLTRNDYTEVGTPVIRGQNLATGGKFVSGDFAFVSNEKVQKDLTSNLAFPGDIIVTQRGTLGQVGIVPTDSEHTRYVVSQSQMALRPDGQATDPSFLYYYLQSPQFNNYVSSATIQTGVPHINLTILRDAPTDFPRLGRQIAIASVLQTLDDKIDLNRRMNATLEAQARALFRDWFVTFGPTRAKMTGQTPYLPAELWNLFPDRVGNDGLPEGWTRSALSTHIKIIGGGTPKTSEKSYWGGEIPWFSVKDTPLGSDLFVFQTEKTITQEGLQSSSAKLVPPGVTILSARGTVGNTAISGQTMAFNQSCYAIEPASEGQESWAYFGVRNGVEILRDMAHGSVFSTITRSTFDNVDVADSGHTLRLEFSTIVAKLLDKIRANGQENLHLKATRDYLLPKLMSGDVEVAA